MTQRRSNLYCQLGLAISLVIGSVFFAEITLAQILPDRTLGAESSIVTPDVVIDGSSSTQIDGGAIRGQNLFHSFQEFNVGEAQRVYFTTPAGVENILSRVTGSNGSLILGKLGVLGNSNLFLINPKGIIFGANASLDLKGSFIATTASSLNLADGNQFSATTSPASPLLTVSVPIGLQFGDTAPIRVQAYNLEVQPFKTLGLLGGDVIIEGGYLVAPGGRIELGGVASNSLVSLNPIAKGWALGYEGVQNFQNVQLIKGKYASVVSAFGEGGGDIQVQGRQVILADSSQIINQGAETGGNLTVTASELVQITGIDSALASDTITAADAGNITINTSRLLIGDRAFIQTQSSRQQQPSGQITQVATGRGGNLTVNASESVELVNDSSVSSGTLGSGSSGNVTINTKKLFVRDGSSISAYTRGEGQGGTVAINAFDLVEVSSEDSSLHSDAYAVGNAGDLKIETGNLRVRDGAELTVSSQQAGDAGDIEITTASLRLEGGKLTATSASGRGGGNINIDNADLLLLRTNSEISTNAAGDGMGGNINIDTNLLTQDNSDITANAIRGMGGNITINTQGIFRTPNSEISAISQLGVNGVVSIKRLQSDPNPGLIALPNTIVDTSRLIAQGCGSSGVNVAKAPSSLTVTGRGGMPPDPQEVVNSEFTLADLGSDVKIGSTGTTVVNPRYSEVTPIVEAQAWSVGKNGEVVLTAQLPNATPSWFAAANCQP